MKPIVSAAAAFLLAAGVVLLPAGVRAATDVQAEIMTAATHAGLASKATAVAMVHMHLQHTVNCLEGPKGKDFDAKQANPCAMLGDGAIADTSDAGQKKALGDAVTKAESGIASTDLAASQKIAADVSTMLKAVK
jgi:hypothetical protein